MSQRILIIAPRFPVSDDRVIATWALNQAKALRRKGAEVEVISPSPYIPTLIGDLLDYERWSELDSQRTFDGLKVFYPRVPVYNIDSTKELYDRFPWLETEPLWIFSRQVIKNRINSFNPDALLCHHPIPGGYIGMKAHSVHDVPYITVEHSLTDIKRASENLRRYELYDRIVQNSAVSITVSQMMKDQIQDSISRNYEIEVIYNGYDPDEIELNDGMSTESEERESFHILSVGSFIERKGHRYLIKALSQLKDRVQTRFHCTLVGSGPLEKELQELIGTYGIGELIEFRSGLNRTELNRLMASTDFFALPSWDEPCAVVYPEVMAHGVPTLMCKGQGFSELIEDEKTGFLVKPRDATAIADTLSKVTTNQDMAQRVGIRGQRLVKAKLTWDDNAEKICKVINQNI